MSLSHPPEQNQLPYEAELEFEQEHLTDTKAKITTAIDITLGRIKPSEDFTDVAVNTMFHEEAEHLTRSKDYPYFARIMFQEHGQKFEESAYIGRFGLFDRASYTPIIIDWRAPIANLYYEDQFEDVEIDTGGKQPLHFDVHKKRQFEIKNGRVEAFYDSTGTVNTNHLLMERLQEKSDIRLKDIVETIQADQNRVIRAEAHRAMIVQGVAGSGKTTIALHRLSFLAYQQKSKTSHQPFLVIAPNRFMIDYISEVLPHLGVDGVVQTTWEDLLLSKLPNKVKLKNMQQKNQRFLENSHLLPTEEYQVEIVASRLRTSLAMQLFLDKYMDHYVKTYLPENDLVLDSKHKIPHATIHKQFHEDYQHYPIMRRREKIIQSMQRFAKESLASWETSWEKRSIRMSATEQLKKKAEMQAQYEKILAMYTAKLKIVDVMKLYKKLLTNPRNIKWLMKESGIGHPSQVDAVIAYLTRIHDGNDLEWEDVAAIFYLTVKFNGMKTTKYHHLIIDEAQDLAPFQVSVLKEFVNQDAISIFGDLSQSIYAYRGVKSWEEYENGVFAASIQKFQLQKSYRSTMEIMDTANQVVCHLQLPEEAVAEPVLRHGDVPVIQQIADELTMYSIISDWIEKLRKDGYQNIAIVEKNQALCAHVAKSLRARGITTDLITDRQPHYQGGLLVIPVYLAKGMEFDAVILVNPTAKKYNPSIETDVKLLYVAMTRALHHLMITGWEPFTPLFEKKHTASQNK